MPLLETVSLEMKLNTVCVSKNHRVIDSLILDSQTRNIFNRSTQMESPRGAESQYDVGSVIYIYSVTNTQSCCAVPSDSEKTQTE